MGLKQTRLRIENDTFTNITKISVWSVDGFDWDSSQRPDMQFNGEHIKAKGNIEKELIINTIASICPFNMKLTFEDGLKDCFRIDQKYAVGKAANFSHFESTHDINYHRKGDTVVITVKNTSSQLIHKKTEGLMRQGNYLLSVDNFNEALAKFDEALAIVQDPGLKRSLITNKVSALLKYSEKFFDDGWKAESGNRLTEAMINVQHSKSILEQAIFLENSDILKSQMKLIDLRLKGYKYLSDGDVLYQSVLLSNNDDFEKLTKVKLILEDANVLYEKAKDEFEEGKLFEPRFEESIAFVKKAIGKVIEAINNVNQNISKKLNNDAVVTSESTKDNFIHKENIPFDPDRIVFPNH